MHHWSSHIGNEKMEEERINKIKISLEQVHQWPSVYIFKFIIPTLSESKEELLNIFPENVEITTKKSRNGKYTSYTIKELILNSEEVLERYIAASKIEGIVSL